MKTSFGPFSRKFAACPRRSLERCRSTGTNGAMATPLTATPDAAEDAMSTDARIVSETLLHQRYLTLYNRRIHFDAIPGVRKETELQFDIVGHPRSDFRFAVVFPFHPSVNGSEPQVTVIREYCQGPHCMGFCLPTGGYDPNKHVNLADCAAAELSEEALLHGGTLVQLVPPEHPGFAEVKWCANRFIPFLCMDPEADPNPGKRDTEEVSIQVHRMTISQLRTLVTSGEMMLPSMTTTYIALQYLERNGWIS